MPHPPEPNLWQGRNDGDAPDLWRWHQVVECTPLAELTARKAIAILGFACDEGVRRNKGRLGASAAPSVLRSVCANFPAHSLTKGALVDVGDCVCEGTQLEEAQGELADAVAQLVQLGYRPMVFGGGHEVMYGHFRGLRKAFPDQKIGIINFDAHFDIREPDPAVGASSGTGFWQLAQEESDFHYLALGIQTNSNTQRLFATAKRYGVKHLLADDFYPENIMFILHTIATFMARVDKVYLTICMDVFAAPYAPGVSALAYNGLVPSDRTFRRALQAIISSPKLVSADIAELNPRLDIDNRTARLAASLVFEIVNAGAK